MITQSLLKDLFDYNQDTGEFIRKVSRRGISKAGTRAGTVNNWGYRMIWLEGTSYGEHRLAWLYVHGEWPINQIDHINRIKTDNRISNLRLATVTQNNANKIASNNSLAGLKGVGYEASKIKRKWRATITINHKRHSLGHYDCPAAAHFAYIIAADTHFGEYARFR